MNISGEQFKYEIDKTVGTLTSMQHEGTEILTEGPLFNAWRAPLMNDAQEWNGEQAPDWRTAGLDALDHHLDSVSVSRTDEHVQVDVESFARGNADESSSPGFETAYRYRFFGDGTVTISVDAAPNAELKEIMTGYLSKVGVQLELPSRFENVEWYGRGPQETYPDRKTGGDIGRYAGTVAGQYVPYSRRRTTATRPTSGGWRSPTRKTDCLPLELSR